MRFLILIFSMSLVGVSMMLAVVRRAEPIDAAWIVFETNWDGNWNLYRMSPNGDHVQAVVTHPAHDYAGSFSPDGKKLLFTSARSDPRNLTGNIFLASNTGHHPQQLTFNEATSTAAQWSPDMRLISYIELERNFANIYFLDVKTLESHIFPLSNNVETTLSWAADSQEVIFSSRRTGEWEIYRALVDGSDLMPLTDDGTQNSSPSWSPNNEIIVFASRREDNISLYQMLPDGSNITPITTFWPHEVNPSWSPDGAWIVFNANRHGNWDIFKIRPDGSELTRLTSHVGNELLPSWSPTIDLAWHGWLLMGGGLLGIMVAIIRTRFYDSR